MPLDPRRSGRRGMGDQRYPLAWPPGEPRRPLHERKTARYGQRDESRYGIKPLTIAQSVRRLYDEVKSWTRVGKTYRVDPDEVIISSNLILNRDGSPRSNQRDPDDPAVAVYLTMDGQPLCIPSDKWDRAADNIAAIAKWLKTQREAELTGAGSTAATFRGYAALPAATEDSWYQVLGFRQMPEDLDELKRSYRALVTRHHPDLFGGEATDTWHRIQSAYQQGLDALS